MQEQASNEVCSVFFELVQRRAKSEPIAYITGYKDFMSLTIKVTPKVLIPRPETEILVEHVIEHFNGKQAEILELCTGSGCIAVALAKYLPKSKITAVDISETALQAAAENIRIGQLEQRVNLIKCDILSPNEITGQTYDAIVSNPPYIKSADVLQLMPDVRLYEPSIALDGGADGVAFYRAIAGICSKSLKAGGLAAVEIGVGQAEEVAEIFSGGLEDIRVLKDFSGIERVVTGKKIKN